MKQLFIDFGASTLEVEVADDADLDGRFAATCLDTGERLWISGWLAADIEEI